MVTCDKCQRQFPAQLTVPIIKEPPTVQALPCGGFLLSLPAGLKTVPVCILCAYERVKDRMPAMLVMFSPGTEPGRMLEQCRLWLAGTANLEEVRQ